ncbi:hypothetical protein [Ruegeria sp. PrR005]|uniref:Uncharacterized protein n=1 Tax=Ruegeria sp. PrR005 TaxID=2706882 RepID=A0A6B2NR90_9RHOB|nr:hypothetical protein [Ruegeria sp. PrR005]NDW46691.1 hypothetical protein [Ruegeria sp. PrR005]
MVADLLFENGIATDAGIEHLPPKERSFGGPVAKALPSTPTGAQFDDRSDDAEVGGLI